MENPREKAYSFSYCLFSYIYKDMYERTELPVTVDYTVPCTKLFKSDIGECVLHVCRVHEKFLNPVFSKIFPGICISEAYFFEYVRWYYEKVACAFTEEYYHLYAKCNFEANPVGPFFIKFLTLCSFITELVRYCFHRKCYTFTSSGPTSLAEIILTIPEIDEYFPSVTEAFDVLSRFCLDVMNDEAISANSLCDLFMRQSDILQENCALTLYKNSLPQSVLTLPSSAEMDTDVNCPAERNQSATRHSYKRKLSYTSGDKDWCDEDMFEGVADYFTVGSPDSVTDTERCYKLSNIGSECVDAYESNNSSEGEMSPDNRCPHCKEVCLMYLDEFVDDFKETNYEDEYA